MSRKAKAWQKKIVEKTPKGWASTCFPHKTPLKRAVIRRFSGISEWIGGEAAAIRREELLILVGMSWGFPVILLLSFSFFLSLFYLLFCASSLFFFIFDNGWVLAGFLRAQETQCISIGMNMSIYKDICLSIYLSDNHLSLYLSDRYKFLEW